MIKWVKKFIFLPFVLVSSLIVYILCLLFIDKSHFYAKLAAKELLQEYWNPSIESNFI